MSQKEVAIVGNNNTKAAITGANELLIRINSLAASAGLATEATLLQILNNMIASQDIEILLVRDTGNADKVVQQIREYDQGTGTWVTRYEDVDGTAYVPVGPLEYLDPSAVLNLMLTELLDQGLTLDNILIAIGNIYSTIHVEEDDNAIPEGLTLPTGIVELYGHWDGAWQRLTTDGNNRLVIAADSLPLPTGAATEVTLASLNAKLNSLGQKASAASAPVVLSTEQEAILATIDSVLDTIKTDTALINSNVVLGNITLNAIDTVLDAIKLDTANLDVALSTRASEATLQLIQIVLDNIKTDTALINTNIQTGNGLLQTIDADTSNLDVLLSTRATEATLVTVNNTLGFIFGQLQTIDNNISTRASEATLVAADQKLGYLTVDKTPTSIASTGVTNIPAFATEISIFNNGTGDATVNGVKCPPGVTRTFGFKNPTSAIIVCDGLGTEELIIDYMA